MPRPAVSLAEANDHVAAKVLPHARPAVFEKLALQGASKTTRKETEAENRPRTLWQKELACVNMCAGAVGSVVAICDDGCRVSCFDVRSGTEIWSRESEEEIISILSSPTFCALGDECGRVHVWSAETGEPLSLIDVQREGLEQQQQQQQRTRRKRSNANRWVEHLCWDSGGKRVAAACGRHAIVARAKSGAVEASFQCARGTVAGMSFCPHTKAAGGAAGALGVAAYGGMQWLRRGLAPLPCGAAAILSLSVSNTGTRVAVGLLSKCMRVFDTSRHVEEQRGRGEGGGQTGGELRNVLYICLNPESASETHISRKPHHPVDWTGFDSGVTAVCWSHDDAWLAGAGGTCLLAVPRGLKKAQPPVLCRTPGLSAADGAGGTCGRLVDAAWCPATFGTRGGQGLGGSGGRMLAAVEGGRRGMVHIFEVSKQRDARVPRRALPVVSVEAPGHGPTTSLKFAVARGEGEEGGEKEEDGVLVLVRGGVASVVSV